LHPCTLDLRLEALNNGSQQVKASCGSKAVLLQVKPFSIHLRRLLDAFIEVAIAGHRSDPLH
jgi:hypothetical protein